MLGAVSVAVLSYLGFDAIASFAEEVTGGSRRVARAVLFCLVLAGTLFVLTGVDPITVTEYSLVLSAAALPLTYLPIFVVANDRSYLGDRVNSRFTNVLGSVYLVLLSAVSLAAIPLMVYTKAGQ